MSDQNLHPELRNLLLKLFPTNDQQDKVYQLCISEFESDCQSRSEWMEMQEEWLDMYFQRERTVPPFQGASEESIPMLTEACSQFHARALKAMFRSENAVRVVPCGHIDDLSRVRADRLSQHMRYTIFDKIPNYMEDKDSLLLAVALRGSMFTKAYIDPLRGQIKVKNIRPTDLVLPYGIGPRAMEDIPRKTEIHWIPYYLTQRYVRNNFFSYQPETYKVGAFYNIPQLDQSMQEMMGLQEQNDVNDYCLVLEQHRWLDITGDGYQAPVVVWLDPIGQKVIRVSVDYETDEAGVPTDPYALPIEGYTHWPFIPNPDGTYGLGYGIILGEINKAVNKLLRTIIDGSVFATMSGMSGFIDKRASMAKTEMKLELGKFIPVSNLESIKNGIWTPNFGGPNASLINIMEFLAGRGDRLGMLTELVTGQSEKVMQPTAVMALLQQTDIIFTAVHERLMRSWSRELQAIYDLNSKYLNTQEYFTMMDVMEGDYQTMSVMQSDYNRDFQVKPIIAKASSDQERVALSDSEMQVIQMFPTLQADPITQWKLLRRRLEAIGTTPIEELLPPLEQWLMSAQQAMEAAQVENQIKPMMQEDKQKWQEKENEKDRTQETKITKMELEAKHEDVEIQAEAQKAQAEAQAEVTRAVGNVKVENEKIKGQEIKKDGVVKRQQMAKPKPKPANNK
jgi:hypothetical protein